ncbi:MAG: methyltransferase domain-containing protein [Verrucomicrobiales bacterium]
MNTQSAVRDRYAAGAKSREDSLCCPVDYDRRYLEVIPEEVIARDYGCGDPSKYLHPGETVLDLGSGTGKICFIASQVVGSEGKVIGVDMTDDMLEVARRNAPLVAERTGCSNVSFYKGRIEDLALDLEKFEEQLQANPVASANDFLAAEDLADKMRSGQPMIAENTIDVVVSNCVLNLVDNRLKKQLFREIYRVLKIGGRAVISDIVCDEPVPEEMQDDPELWSGCISGAFIEDEFLCAFENAGFHGVQILQFGSDPWKTVNGIEFRSMTVEAFKGDDGPCLEGRQAVIYRGPFKKVVDDDGHPMERGKRYALCMKTYEMYRRAPYSGYFEFIEPHQSPGSADAEAFDCTRTRLRAPRETKGSTFHSINPAACCSEDQPGAKDPGNCC